MPLGPSGNFLKKERPKLRPAAGILPHLGDAVFGGYGRDLDHRVAPDGAARTAVSPDRVLPGDVAQVEDGIVRPVGNPVQVVGFAGPRFDGTERRLPRRAPWSPSSGCLEL